MQRRIRAIAALAATVMIAAGCSRAASGGGSTAAQPTAPAQSTAAAQSATQAAQAASASGNFGDLTNVCHPGSAAGATDQGVTSGQIMAGVLTDVGFTKDPDVVNAAHVFTSWCNAAGGIDGRKLVADIHDAKLLDVVQAMTAACGSDFTLAGGSAGLDGLAVSTRVKCLLPDFDAQVVMPQNDGSGLQVYPISWPHDYSPYTGYYQWLLKEYPGSGSAVGILAGASVITATDDGIIDETLKAEGATTVDQISFPAAGVADWTPYAESIKDKGLKGLVYFGAPQGLAALEQVLTDMNYKLDWIDTDVDGYGAAGKSLSFQHNYADLPGVYPAEKAAGNPATEEVVKLFAQYEPGQPVTEQVLQAFSAWLIFAESAETCGSDLTRACVYEAALKQTAWTGGGLTAPVDLAKPDSPPTCFDVEQATAAGWQPAPFGPNDGAYRCGDPVYKLRGSYPPAVSLADVGKSLSDLKQ
jgi:hypothetical protein